MELSTTDLLGIVAGSLTTASFLPQVVKAWRSGHTKDVSIFMFLLLFIGLVLWIAYGIVKGDMPIVLANAISIALVSAILYFKIKYG